MSDTSNRPSLEDPNTRRFSHFSSCEGEEKEGRGRGEEGEEGEKRGRGKKEQGVGGEDERIVQVGVVEGRRGK